jgi:hypothetical protein
MTMRQTIDIPANREVNIHLVVPATVPCGKTDVILDFPETQRAMPTVEELIKEAEDRAARERETGYSTFGSFKGCLKDSPCFAGRTGEEIQRELRDEWND